MRRKLLRRSRTAAFRKSNPEYRMDYRRTLPQILLPGYQIPLFPERDERKAIRKSFNTAGFWIFMSCVLEQVLFLVLMLVIFLCMGVSPGQYLFGLSDKAQAYFQNSSLLIALNGLLFSVLNTSIALIGCRRMRIAPRSLFQTKDLRAGTAIRYIITGISLQCVAGLAYTALESIFSVSDQLAEADFSYFQSGKSIIATMLYTCILAPVTEELLYRGFLMKTLSRVGCRFAIIVSALMFGMAHGNISQMMLGVLVGLFLGKIDMRHNSLLPSILVHMGINTTSMILNLLQYYSDSSLGAVRHVLLCHCAPRHHLLVLEGTEAAAPLSHTKAMHPKPDFLVISLAPDRFRTADHSHHLQSTCRLTHKERTNDYGTFYCMGYPPPSQTAAKAVV